MLELMFVAALLAILGALAVPQMYKLRATYDRMDAKAYLAQDLKRAQAESITQGCRGIFKILNGGRTYQFGCDYLNYDTRNPPSPDVVSLSRTLPANIILFTPSPIIFNSKGQTVDVDGVISNLNLSLRDVSRGSAQEFALGILLGTGVFNYES